MTINQQIMARPIEVWACHSGLYAVFITPTSIEFVPVSADTGLYDCVYLNDPSEATYELVLAVKQILVE